MIKRNYTGTGSIQDKSRALFLDKERTEINRQRSINSRLAENLGLNNQ